MRLHIHTLLISLLKLVLCFFLFFFFVWLPLIPNKHVFFSFFFPISSISRYLYADPLHCNMTYLFLRLLKDDLREYTYAARLAGLVYGIAAGMNAILVSKPFEVWREVGVPLKGPFWGFGRVWKWLGFLRSIWLSDVLCALFVQPEGL